MKNYHIYVNFAIFNLPRFFVNAMKCQNTALSCLEYSLAMPKAYLCAILGKKASRPKNGPKVVVLVNASIWAKKFFPK